MGKKTKIWLVIATALVLAGCIIFGGVMSMLKWDFRKLSTEKYETNSYEMEEDYQNISVAAKNADILFVPSEDTKTSVVCYQQKNVKHTVTVRDGALVIETTDTRKWYERFGIHFDTPKITVSIPRGEYSTLLVKSNTGDVEIPKEFEFERIDISQGTGNVTNYACASEEIKIKASTGNIYVETISVGALDLSVSTGQITVCDVTCQGDVKLHVSTGEADLSDMTCKNLISTGNTGDISIKDVTAAEAFSIKRSTGDVKLKNADAAEIFIETDTGDVRGSLLTDKVFLVHTDTGKVKVPKTTTGGVCEVNTNTGDIHLTVSD